MKIVVLSDTHIPDRAKSLPEAVLKEIKTADMVIHAGDMAEPSVLQQLQSLCPNVKAVAGNMDPHSLKKQLKEKEIIKAGKYTIGLAHGFGPSQQLIELMLQTFLNDKVDIIIFGHSHQTMNEKKGDILFFNPGSPTDTVFAAYNSYGVIELSDSGITAKIIKIS